MKTINYKLTFSSDFHIGSGLGIVGLIDNGIVKDSHNRLFIPATTIKGIIRDTAENILNWLKPGSACLDKKSCTIPNCHCLIHKIFGLPPDRDAHFRFDNAVMDEDISRLIKKDYELLNMLASRSLTSIQTHNQIKRETGIAKEKHLFSYELGSKKLSFFGEITSYTNKPSEDELLVLLSSLHFIDTMGGRRRRGKGKCEFKIEQISGVTELTTQNYKEKIQTFIDNYGE